MLLFPLTLRFMRRPRQPNEYRGQQGEHERLDKGYQHMNQIHEYRKHDSKHRGHACRPRTHGTEQKYHTQQHEHYQMPPQHIGEQTNHQCHRLREHSEQLYQRQKRQRAVTVSLHVI